MRLPMTSDEHLELARPRSRRGASAGSSLGSVVLGAAAGAVALFFLDPQQGRRRRRMMADRVGAVTRRGSRRVGRLTRHAGATLSAARDRVASLRTDDEPVDDTTLTDRVESQVFRDHELPKGELNIDTVGGVVMIRGQVDEPGVMNEILARTWRVEGVKDVRNLMHLPGTPAPHMD